MIKLYEVGGSIRDELMGLPNNDRDFVSVCPGGWPELLAWAENELDKVFLVTPEFFTIRGIRNKVVVDIVMARKDGEYSDGRRPDSVESAPLIDDLARRDLTINAMARPVSLETFEPTGEIIDPFLGASDIQNKVIRVVGGDCMLPGYIRNKFQRLIEDPLRLIRLLRFLALYGFTVEHVIAEVLRFDEFHYADDDNWSNDNVKIDVKPSELIKGVARNRVREELTKLFKANPLGGCRLFAYLPDGLECGDDPIHPDICKAIFGDDIWLKPTTEKRK